MDPQLQGEIERKKKMEKRKNTLKRTASITYDQ